MMRSSLLFVCLLAASTASGALRSAVRIDPPNLHGSRPLEKETQTAVLRDYLQSWNDFEEAVNQNNVQPLNQEFVGTALKKITDTIQQQKKLGIHTRYQATSHHIQIVFYSPDGLSIQLIDHVAYHVELFDRNRMLAERSFHARYVVVLTPSAVRWVVRIFQATPAEPDIH